MTHRVDVVVTGGSGRLGRRLVPELLARGLRVLNLDLHPSDQVETIRVDLSSTDHASGLSIQTDSLIHLAATPRPQYEKPGEVFRNNLLCTFNVLESCKAWKPRTIVLASSEAVFGFAFDEVGVKPLYLPLNEEHPCRPNDHYSLSKWMTEDLGRAFSLRSDVSSVIALRFAWILPPEEQPAAVARVRADIHRGVSKLFSYVDARDAVNAIVAAREAQLSGFCNCLVSAPDTLSELSTAELVSEFYTGTSFVQPAQPFASLIQSQRAGLLGIVTRHSWRGRSV